jgi:hypothetical protein
MKVVDCVLSFVSVGKGIETWFVNALNVRYAVKLSFGQRNIQRLKEEEDRGRRDAKPALRSSDLGFET